MTHDSGRQFEHLHRAQGSPYLAVRLVSQSCHRARYLDAAHHTREELKALEGFAQRGGLRLFEDQLYECRGIDIRRSYQGSSSRMSRRTCVTLLRDTDGSGGGKSSQRRVAGVMRPSATICS